MVNDVLFGRCPSCNGALSWCNDHCREEFFGEGEGLVSIYSCNNCAGDVIYVENDPQDDLQWQYVEQMSLDLFEEEPIEKDNVNHPNHYTSGKIETKELYKLMLTTEERRGGFKMNMIKYLTRYQHKNGVEDLKKLIKYAEFLIALEEGDEQ